MRRYDVGYMLGDRKGVNVCWGIFKTWQGADEVRRGLRHFAFFQVVRVKVVPLKPKRK